MGLGFPVVYIFKCYSPTVKVLVIVQNDSTLNVCYRVPKIFYCSRTHQQIQQVVRELRKTVYKDVK